MYMSDFSFGKINVKSRKQVVNLKTYDSPLLMDKSNARASYNLPIVILTEEHFEQKEISYIDRFLASEGITRYIMLDSINCEYSEKDAKEGLIKFYKANKSNFMDYIPYGAPIITSGPALYSLIQEDDIYPNYMNQMLFGKSNFWFSYDLRKETCPRVFPISSFKADLFGYDIYKKWCSGAVDSYKTKIARVQMSNAIKFTSIEPPEYPELNKVFIGSAEEFDSLFYQPNKDRKGEVLAWDLETSGLNFLRDRIGCITLSFDGITGYYIPWKYVDKKKLGEILKNNRQLGHNLKFDVKHLLRNGVPEAHIDEDTLYLAHTLDETRSNSLKAMAFLYSQYGGYERPLDEYKAKMGKEINYLDIPEETLRDYAVMDAIVTRRIWNTLMSHMRELDKAYPNEFAETGTMEHYYYTFRIPAAQTYTDMEYRGCYVDKEKLDNLRDKMKSDIADIKKKLCEHFNVKDDFQWESGQQLGILLEKSGWEDLGRTKSGEYATGDFQLSRWKKTHKEAELIEKLKSLNTLLNTFVGDETSNSVMANYFGYNDEEGEKGWTQYLQYHEEDDSWRMHANFLPMMADSGRSRCTEPNLQQVPSHGSYAKEIKKCIKTPNDEEYYMVTCDYSSLQLRIATQDIRDTEDPLYKILQKGRSVDLHSTTAYNTFYKGKEIDVDIITVTQDGKTYQFLGGEAVDTVERGEIFACELTENDTLIVE